jgi:hypothetical protein
VRSTQRASTPIDPNLGTDHSVTHIVIITHRFDDFARRDYLLRRLIENWIDAGHQVTMTAEVDAWPDADVAILHVDLTRIPAAYVEASRRYPVVINGAANDISKTLVSRYLVRPNDGWNGPVMIKTDLNCGGLPEARAGRLALRNGMRPDFDAGAMVCTSAPYPILRNSEEVPAFVWDNPGLVVERFLPERDVHGFWMRAWVFCGDQERCTRYLGKQPIVKSADILAREPVAVPEALRAERQRLGFDYGKFDFVIHESTPILFDANRTPFAPPPGPEIEASNANLARGLAALLRD